MVEVSWTVMRAVVQSLSGESVLDMTWSRACETFREHATIAALIAGRPVEGGDRSAESPPAPTDESPAAALRSFTGRPE